MGVLDSIFGSGSGQAEHTEQEDEKKYAILLNAGPDRTAVAGNGFGYAIEFDDAGYETQLFLDGKATKWPAEYSDNPGSPFNREWVEIQERSLLAGACGFCANAFDAAEACERSGIELLSDKTEHAPAVANLAAEDYEILPVG